MNDDRRLHDLGPLPKRDDNAALQEVSFRALRAALPISEFHVRDERIDDAGVDLSLELLIESRYTNVRAQVQLKGTASPDFNADGSISLQVEASNLNYLLYGTSSLYILYVEPADELRYVWALDERRRLDEMTPAWMQQKTITLRFCHALTPSALAAIRQRILQEAQLRRRILDQVGRSSLGEPVVVRIDPATLSTIESEDVNQLLINGGLGLVASGFASEVLRQADVHSPGFPRPVRLHLVCAYANYTLGRYQAAAAELADAALQRDLLSADDQMVLDLIGHACDYHTGAISLAEYVRLLEDQSRPGTRAFSLTQRLNVLYYGILGEAELSRRAELLQELQQIIDSELEQADVPQAIKLHARLLSLYGEASVDALAFSQELSLLRMRRDMQQRPDLGRLNQIVQDRWGSWDHKIEAALQEALSLQHPLLIADGLFIRAGGKLSRLLNCRAHASDCGSSISVPASSVQPIAEDAQQAASLYAQAQTLEGELRAKLLLADLWEYADRQPEARILAEEVLPKARAMKLAHHEKHAQEHISGRTALVNIEAQMQQSRNTDQDLVRAQVNDEELQEATRLTLEALHLPEDRLQIVERDLRSHRDIARERLDWCQHIELVQDLRHTRHPATYYRTDPTRHCRCEKHGYQSRVGDSQWPVVIAVFKKTYCYGCADRSPKREPS